jgi:hypothetical protein
MGAYLEHKFHRGFFLDEEKLRKLHDLIVARIGKASALASSPCIDPAA